MKALKFLLTATLATSLLIGVSAQAESPTRSTAAKSPALKVGDKAPDFILKNAEGKDISLSHALKKGPVVLTWYRGGWCPYCNVALKELSDHNSIIRGLGAQLIALTPELPDQSLSTTEKNKLNFQVLSDPNLSVSEKYGLVFTLDTATATRYEERFKLSVVNGNKKNQLPIPATYVVDTDGTIVYAYVNENYRERAKPADIIAALQKLNLANSNKLAILWTSGDPRIAENFVGMYGPTAKRAGWFEEVNIILWGPANKLVVENPHTQAQLKKMLAAGVKVYSCQACAQSYGLVNSLRALGVDVRYMGEPLTTYLKRGYRTLSL